MVFSNWADAVSIVFMFLGNNTVVLTKTSYKRYWIFQNLKWFSSYSFYNVVFITGFKYFYSRGSEVMLYITIKVCFKCRLQNSPETPDNSREWWLCGKRLHLFFKYVFFPNKCVPVLTCCLCTSQAKQTVVTICAAQWAGPMAIQITLN